MSSLLSLSLTIINHHFMQPVSYTMTNIFSSFQYWLSNHPNILHFSWSPGETWCSSPLFLTLTVFSYLFFTFLLSHLPLPPIQPRHLKAISAVHNLILLTFSFIMALGCCISTLSRAPNFHWIICLPPQTSPTGPLFFWGYMFYLSKIYEFVDTLLIIMGKSTRRLTFLHVYHHAMVVIMCYIWMETSQSLFPVVLVTNASVHVIMYAYYFLCALGVRPKWKRLLTECQILQFICSFVALGMMLYYHFTGLGCSGVWGWCFNMAFYSSLLALFLDFHSKNYTSPKNGHKLS